MAVICERLHRLEHSRTQPAPPSAGSPRQLKPADLARPRHAESVKISVSDLRRGSPKD